MGVLAYYWKRSDIDILQLPASHTLLYTFYFQYCFCYWGIIMCDCIRWTISCRYIINELVIETWIWITMYSIYFLLLVFFFSFLFSHRFLCTMFSCFRLFNASLTPKPKIYYTSSVMNPAIKWSTWNHRSMIRHRFWSQVVVLDSLCSFSD